MAGAREEILEAFRRLERRSGRRVFQLRDVVAEVLSVTNSYNETTLRTYVTSVMCADAPIHHANHTNDLSRLGHGLYALSGTGEVTAGKEPARKPLVAPSMEEPSAEPANPSWHWEGNVQAAIVTGLASQGWAIQAVSDTQSRASGTDVIATREGRRLHMEVKGYPTTTYARGAKAGSPKPTNPATQARHWFAGALLKAAMLRNDYPDDLVAMGFPDFATYRALAARVSTTLDNSDIALIWVDENGSVHGELDRDTELGVGFHSRGAR